jgi:exoribonuclease R
MNRRDMRYIDFTIDPKDAKDFDDALSFKLENGIMKWYSYCRCFVLSEEGYS